MMKNVVRMKGIVTVGDNANERVLIKMDLNNYAIICVPSAAFVLMVTYGKMIRTVYA